MENKDSALDTATQKLLELINALKSHERDFDKAVEHSANYLGNDDRIEQFRDDRASEALQHVNRVKVEIAAQIELVAKLAANY